MDIAAVVGLIGAIGLIVMAMGDPGPFVDQTDDTEILMQFQLNILVYRKLKTLQFQSLGYYFSTDSQYMYFGNDSWAVECMQNQS